MLQLIGDERVRLVMSNAAPNMSGIAEVDGLRGMYLVELALDFPEKVLARGGENLVKVFQGRDCQPFVQRWLDSFGSLQVRKSKASRARSAELYLLAREFRM